MFIIFHVEGGIGKNVAGTAVIRAIKKQYPDSKIVVVTAHPEVYACNPNVYKTINFGSALYFFQDYIDNHKDTIVFAQEPYKQSDFILERCHLIQAWCDLCRVPFDGDIPDLFMTEIEYHRYAPSFSTNKPILLVQTSGGAGNDARYSWVRDLPMATAQQVVNAFAQDFHVVHLRTKDQPALQNTTPVQAVNLRALIVLIAVSSKRLFIDSCAQHIAAALGLPSVVCWIGNKVELYGYGLHANVLASPPTRIPDLRHSVYNRNNISGDNPTETCYNHQNEIFNPEIIIHTLRNYPPPQQVNNTAQANNPPIQLHQVPEADIPPPQNGHQHNDDVKDEENLKSQIPKDKNDKREEQKKK